MDGAGNQARSLKSDPTSGLEMERLSSSELDHGDVVDDWLDSIDVRHWPALYDHLAQGASQLQREFAMLDHECDEQTAQSVALLVCCAAAHELSPMELYCLLESPQRSTLDGYTRLRIGSVGEQCERSGSSVPGRDARSDVPHGARASDASTTGRADASHLSPATADQPNAIGHTSGSRIIESKDT